MADARRSTVKCEELQRALRESPGQAHALTAAESAHVECCDACLEVWLESTVTGALDAKPEVRIPEDFALRVAAKLPARNEVVHATKSGARATRHHWGLVTAIALVTVGLFATAAADPAALATRMGAIFMLIVAAEIVGIALWLGMGRLGERRS
jgi:hypothetical protein